MVVNGATIQTQLRKHHDTSVTHTTYDIPGSAPAAGNFQINDAL